MSADAAQPTPEQLEAIRRLFDPLYDDIKQRGEWFQHKPYLAHYTSVAVLEKILTSQEVWFSNPLFMNDLEEVRFGILNGARLLRENADLVAALKTDGRRQYFYSSLDHYLAVYEEQHLFDTYVFCLTEQLQDNRDGLLSMWRGYGGNGRGAAIVFDTSKMQPLDVSPLILAKVHYGSSEDRLAWINTLGAAVAGILGTSDIPDDKVYLAAFFAFERLKLFALFSKHRGFAEENEWRVAYLRERDTEGKLTGMFDYVNGPRGVEPKLRFKVSTIDGVTPPGLSLDSLVSAILLGPSVSSPLAKRSVERMLEKIGKPELKDRLFASTIPLRPT